MADELNETREIKPVPISQLPSATKLEKSMLFAAEQDGVAEKVTGEQLVELSRGPAGPQGPAGAEGVSPTVSFSAIDGGNRMNVKDAEGTKSIDVMNGKDGNPGPAGPAGKDATINGENSIELVEGENVKITQEGGKVTISATGGRPPFTTDDTLTLQDDVLSVALPTKAVTKAQYNALSEEEKMAEVQYILTDDSSGGGGSSQDIYSTEETVIGAWIDGRPIYRTVWSGKFNVSNNNGYFNVGLNIGSFAQMITMCGMITRSSDGYPDVLPFNNSDGNKISPYVTKGGTVQVTYTFYSDSIRNSYNNGSYFILLEYTKTTDEAVK